MGACASVPKDIKAEAAAPLPEQPKEEETTTAVDKHVNGGGEKVAAGYIDKSNSLGSLLSKGEVAKESSEEDEKSSETMDEKPEEAKVSEEMDTKQPAAAEEKST